MLKGDKNTDEGGTNACVVDATTTPIPVDKKCIVLVDRNIFSLLTETYCPLLVV